MNTSSRASRQLLREPLLHFLLLGALVYGLYWFNQGPAGGVDASRIVVTAGEIEWMEASWEKRWGRGPTPAEIEGLVRDYVRETVMYREALAMGLDRDDTIVRRRLAQKLKFLAQDLLQVEPATEEQLRAYMETKRDQYTEPARLSFTHVFVDPDRRGEATLGDADRLLRELQTGGAPSEESGDLGDPLLLQAYYPERDESEISKLFGRGFATEVLKLEPGVWNGPVLSGYGVHLVFVHDREDARPLPFDAIRERVQSDWQDGERSRLDEEYYARLLERYEVSVEEPVAKGVAAAPAASVTP